MTIANYIDLQAAVGNWLARSDLLTHIQTFIDLGETMLNRRLHTRDMEASAIVVPSQTVNFVPLPAGYMRLVSFTDDFGTPLVASETISSSGKGRPSRYRISSRVDFDTIADANYNFTFNYIKRLDIATDLTNSVLTNHPDCYLYSALLHSAPFIMDDDRANTWRQLLEVAVRDANNQDSRNAVLLRTDL